MPNLRPITLESFERWVEHQPLSVNSNEYKNWRYLLKMARETPCMDCGKVECTILAGSPDSIKIVWKCADCFAEWIGKIKYEQGRSDEKKKEAVRK